MRVVSLCPSNTEVVGYLGLEDCLVAVDDYSNWPASIVDLPRVGPDLSIDMGQVERMQPDLVLASLSVPGMEKNVEQLEKRGIPHIVLNPNSLADIAEDLQTVATALGFSELGKKKAELFREEVNRYKVQAKKREHQPALYWEWWPKPVFTPGQENWLTEISELAGAYNVFNTDPGANFQTDWDDVLQRNPDFIFIVWPGVEREKIDPASLCQRPGWTEMKAIQDDQIHVLDDSFFCRPSPRLMIGLEHIIQLLWNQSLLRQ